MYAVVEGVFVGVISGAYSALLLLGAMAAAPSPGLAKLAYLLFSGASAAFLALHASQTLRVLPDPARRAFAERFGLAAVGPLALIAARRGQKPLLTLLFKAEAT